jgi:hypothetical protein
VSGTAYQRPIRFGGCRTPGSTCTGCHWGRRRVALRAVEWTHFRIRHGPRRAPPKERSVSLRAAGAGRRLPVRHRNGTGLGQQRTRSWRGLRGLRRTDLARPLEVLSVRSPALAQRRHPGPVPGGCQPSARQRRKPRAQQLLELVPAFPTATWGRDEQRAGEMWNSNSLVSWLLARSGHDTERLHPPARGRAPGWSAGWVVAERTMAASK